MCLVTRLDYKFRGSIVVSIPACHAGNPGSIPGLGAFFACCVSLSLSCCLCSVVLLVFLCKKRIGAEV